ncbi:DUF305 domain-containing protein [Cryptosporangium minutisporangium]|uniref:DUF305 domain-containing protein n=1 Tax=Cryptosporangium minutisporangium TaxID=113569 RepID=A0ABP6T3M9_9ACTN
MKRLVVPAAVFAVLALAACGDDSDMNGMDHGSSATSSAPASATASPSVSTEHNAADVTFAKDMIVHHRQAVEMAEMAATRAADADVKALAAKIEQAQQPEIDTMSGWLTAWGETVPDAKAGMDHGGMGSSSTPMPGGMTDAQMGQLHEASGAAFDKMFLAMMIEHHEGAITMAGTEQQSGENSQAKQLAGTIVTDQTAEITTMRSLLQKG